MIKVSFSEKIWQYVVMFNGLVYTTCDNMRDAETEANMLRRKLRYGL